MIRCLVPGLAHPSCPILKQLLDLQKLYLKDGFAGMSPSLPLSWRLWQPGTPAGFRCVIPSRLFGVVQTSAVDPSSGSASFFAELLGMGGHPCSHTHVAPQPSTLHGRAATRVLASMTLGLPMPQAFGGAGGL